MAEFVNYKDVPFVEGEPVRSCKGYTIGWNVEYEAVWADEKSIVGWKPKAVIYARAAGDDMAFTDLKANCEIKVDKEGAKPVEKRGLYDLYIENHIDIPDTISKDSPCYKQFMKEREMNK